MCELSWQEISRHVSDSDPFSEYRAARTVPKAGVRASSLGSANGASGKGAVPPPQPTGRLGVVRRLAQGSSAVCEWCFGAATLFAGLAFLATLPILQFLSLGYLLEASGRVARSGRLRDGFVGVRKAARVGSLVLGTWIWMWPLWLSSDTWYSAQLIDPNSQVTANRETALVLLTIFIVGHILWAWYRGGRLRSFFWPAPVKFAGWVLRPGKYAGARDAVWTFVTSLRVPYYFWLGVRGFAGAVIWLFFPILLTIGSTELPGGLAVVAGLLGAPLLMLTLVPLPFLQTHFAAEHRFSAMFDVLKTFKMFLRAPIALGIGLFVTLLFALPLYLLKVELLPREAAWLPSLVLVAFIFPALLITGWAVGRARKDSADTISPLRVVSWLGAASLAVPVVGFYALVVFFSRYTSWYGVWSSFEQHAFLVPVPFLGL